jgi:hypothetical protein
MKGYNFNIISKTHFDKSFPTNFLKNLNVILLDNLLDLTRTKNMNIEELIIILKNLDVVMIRLAELISLAIFLYGYIIHETSNASILKCRIKT